MAGFDDAFVEREFLLEESVNSLTDKDKLFYLV